MVTNRPDINQVLSQMRQMREQVQSPSDSFNRVNSQDGLSVNDVTSADKSEFSDMLKQAIDQVNSNQKAATALAQAYERGDPNVDLPEVMIGLQKSSISFEAMTQVRNKLVDAYEKIMNMPV
ncbi:flagellar hook-basal body complex protein FliE [Marinomonas mediterranea]|jgi:flagellar hook-basal body complex protein FliE|uniref:Flagellar hook-basal body complex protein FliE n=1 Tax=Marinomonas mediterranea (strain ATCC 700492 / JCM 21426 / NBRC 103028 / MMB-1) TaxID=717774 RepID=F2K3L6_MARM1|nr:flagellar hook-basal body complex protein FliE [Marinomonas mediterranea]ADZ92455.1 Flagellar hook-basal body complex protein fliE [Marinomonas mediterranea MMB-1]WCN10405.1 flagellar hook-basal body complex protein FliE [Marinomonas mediterranea]WCN14451.1 flagellar hook-basal body complex protein FliE [Marinomonas mediterranea]WCN18503.1 flagellar hook-basal body complex protein FliE [Marinomonas mediterranea MMB-1]